MTKPNMYKRVNNFGTTLVLCSVLYWGRVALTEIFEDETALVDEWLDQNDLGEYKKLYKEYGISTLSGCGSPDAVDRLPELPAAEERRLRRAAHVLQQRLVLRQWLATHRLQHAYSKLLSLDVSSLEDVYWLEDSAARHVLESKDFGAWSAARQSLPTGKEALQTLKADLWSAVVKNSKHQDAWTWGGMLVVSVSVCGLVTLAAMTQPALAPEAKHSLLQYVTGKYLHPPSCRITPVIELGSGDPALAHTARVHFTVRAAGIYTITVTIGGAGVLGSPFRRRFIAGAVCARLSRVRRHSALVCCANTPRAVILHPRDTHDNPAPLPRPPAGFTVSLSLLGSPPDASLSEAAVFSYDSVNERASLSLTFPAPGVYRAAVAYEGTVLLNGEFDCIVLSESDAAVVARQIGSRREHICYEARLLGARPRRVLCCLGPRQFIVKDYIFKFIPKRITTFRLCPSTKLTLLAREESDTGPAGSLVVEDGVQAALSLWAPRRDLLAAHFTQLLRHHAGADDCFKNKQEYFYAALRKLHARHPHDKLPLRVRRDDLVRSALRATKHFTIADWCKSFDVSFHGEQGVDWGGVRREWFSLVCGQLFDAGFGLFAALHDAPAALVHPNPARPPHLKLKYFELAGKLVGKCLYESALGGPYRQLVRARLTRSFLAQIIGLRVHYKYFEQDDPELYLTKIKYVLETDLDANDAAPEIYFCDDVYENGRFVCTHDLIPNGSNIRVRNSHKLQYLDLVAQWRLAARVGPETGAFLRGLALLVPDTLLAAFDETELELLLCGSGDLAPADWRAHAVQGGSGRDWERLMGWFWAAVESFTPAERARLLQFTTGCSQLPPRGFQELNPRFQITPAPNFGALPTAHTCFNQLCLPDYDGYEQLVKALLWAINEGGEGFGMI
ncbi:unnamed protein product [Chilo suppressalis]|uniref:HECT-type E3 ubiquitin transferase n=1 Tax=Chilo suppressalis TaxID=168631 RepID=A0ABN8EBW8_CHISP|nr:unnamed protein product [Chilo suppressalis]